MEESNMKIFKMIVDTEDEGRTEVVVLAESKDAAKKLLSSKAVVKLYPALEDYEMHRASEIKISTKAKILLVSS